MSKLIPSCALLIILIAAPGAQSQSRSPLWGDLEAGPYAVGFQTEIILDSSRVYIDGSQRNRGIRPILMHTWYPAVVDDESEPMDFFAYGATLAKDRLKAPFSLEDSTQILRALANLVSGDRFLDADQEEVEALARTRTAAHLNATSVQDQFPLVAWGVRHAGAAGQSVLNEYLASHGFVVMECQFAGVRPKYLWTQTGDGHFKRVVEDWTFDLDACLDHVGRKPNVDPGKTAVAGWSYGGLSALLIQMLRPIQAVVMLDSGTKWTVDRMPVLSTFDFGNLRAPTLMMMKNRGDESSVFDALKASQVIRVVMHDLDHGNFNAIEGMIPSVRGLAVSPSWTSRGPSAVIGYETIARTVLQFLDDTENSSSTTLDVAAFAARLQASKNNLSLTTTTKKGTWRGETREAAMMRSPRQTPTEEVTEPDEMVDLALRLIDDVRFQEARQLLVRAAQESPEAGRLHDQISEAYARMGLIELALHHARRCGNAGDTCGFSDELLQKAR